MHDDIYDQDVLLLLHRDAIRAEECSATYQRLMDRVLAPMIGRNVQSYVDDMVVTS